MESAILRTSTSSFLFLSCSSNCFASLTIFLTSVSASLVEAVIVIFCSLPVPRSFADTFRIPDASISNETSIWGIPRGAGGIPTRLNCPRLTLSAAMGRSPWSTWMVTEVWKSAAVEKIWLFFVGIVVFLSISGVLTAPRVSIPSVRGVTSRSTMSVISPPRIAPCTAAPMATHSIGSIPRSTFLPTWSSINFWTIGILVGPPTRITFWISSFVRPASFSACSNGWMQRRIIGSTSCSSFARLSFMERCFGPTCVAET